MSDQNKWLLPDGVDELLPGQAQIVEDLRRYLLDLYARWGYQLVLPPMIEFTDSLLIGLGDDLAKQCFLLTDQISGKSMALRADITSQVARIDAHSMQAQAVNRLCYAGSVVHARPKAILGSRCPILAGAELYGNSSVDADIEVVSLMLETLTKLPKQGSQAPLKGLTLDIGHVAFYRAVEAMLQRAKPALQSSDLSAIYDAVQRKSQTDLQHILQDLDIEPGLIEQVCLLPTLSGGLEVIESVLTRAEKFIQHNDLVVNDALEKIRQIIAVVQQRYPEVNIYIDLAEMRGYRYHTGLVFAAFANGIGAALANGGRYDDVGADFGSARPATGFNVNLKALMRALQYRAPSREVIAAPMLQNAELWQLVSTLRAEGQIVVSVPENELPAYDQRIEQCNGVWQRVN